MASGRIKFLQTIFQTRKYSSKVSDYVKIVEVGPRDGLQNEPSIVPADVKIDFINKLSNTGLKCIEVTSFVSPKWVPQMADNVEVFTGIEKKSSISYPVLVPNVKGLESALSVGAKEIAVFTSASDGFSKKNVNCTSLESLQRVKEIIDACKNKDIKIRGYVSCVVGCPYDGYVKPNVVANITESLLKFGCYEISLGDTIGIGTIDKTKAMLKEVLSVAKPEQIAMHCHDTYGQALVNIFTALDYGIRVLDSSVSGLGGCPYAKGASGNVATEDLVYMLHGMGMETGVHLEELVRIGNFISGVLKKATASKANSALYQKYKL